MFKKIALAAAAVVLLAGCTAHAETPTATAGSASSSASPSPAVVKDATYSTIEEFRDAAELAGLDCSAFAERAKSTYAAAAADCSVSTVISIFTSTEQRDAQAATLKSFADDEEGKPLLIGANWMVNGPISELEAIQPVLGGIVDTSNPN